MDMPSSLIRRASSKRRTSPLLLALGLLLGCPLPASAQLSFTFTYTDPPGVGFNDATLGPARRASLEQTGALLASYLPGYTATISLSVDGAETTDGVLAAAGANFNAANVCDNGFGSRGDVGIKVLGGTDPAPGIVDGTVTVNFEDQVWDLDDNVAPGTFDFKSTMLHELLHALGFSHSVNEDGSSACSQPAGTPAAWGPYDNFLGDTVSDVINNASFILDGPRWATISVGGAGNAGVLWRGPLAVAANGGNPVPLFSPTTFSGGSSIAHLDDEFYTSTALLMEAATDTGPGIRTLANIEVGMLRDMGFTNATNSPGGGVAGRIFCSGFEAAPC